ncbi:MAG: hypothetical protein J2P50_18860 [Hyphomicrobiaceae bacterium]|nr:hypothetical protein [Hyphomicrobiaceae bacterium]
MLAQIGRAEAVRKLPEQDKGLQERMVFGVGKAQARGTLATGRDRTVDGLQGFLGEHTVVAEALHLKEAAVGRKADRAQFGEIAPSPADTDVVGVVDGRLGA